MYCCSHKITFLFPVFPHVKMCVCVCVCMCVCVAKRILVYTIAVVNRQQVTVHVYKLILVNDTDTKSKLIYTVNYLCTAMLVSFDMWKELISFLSVFSTPCAISNDVFG